MHCKKYNKNVLAKDCDECFHWRRCDPVCINRNYAFACSDDNGEPVFTHRYEDAAKLTTDVSFFFDPDWEGNTHLKELQRTISLGKQSIPLDIRWEVWERDNFTCKHCESRRFLSIDHIIPESKGGDLSLSNLQTLCRNCNSKKGANSPE